MCTLITETLSKIHNMGAKRGRTFPAEKWWIEAVQAGIRAAMKENEGDGIPALAERLAKKAKRKVDHAFLTKIRDGKQQVTLELVDAFCDEFHLPPPVIYPHSKQEAIYLLAILSAFDSPEGPPENVSPEEVTERAREVMHHGIRRHRRVR
jgi:hypothetical protein